jgi:hypothetical protein
VGKSDSTLKIRTAVRIAPYNQRCAADDAMIDRESDAGAAADAAGIAELAFDSFPMPLDAAIAHGARHMQKHSPD